MFCITIKFKNEPSSWTLLYNSDEAMRAAWSRSSRETDSGMHYILADEFGQECSIPTACVAAVMLEDLNKSMLAHVERAIHNARTQAKAQQLALSDPVLKTAAMTRGQSPAMFSPQGNGFHP